ncbi:MAG: hypothetical protein ACE5L7_02950 [Candidatus Aminicenantales bacterium]
MSPKKTKRLFIVGIGLLLLAPHLDAALARLEISGSYFFPSEKAFRDIYGPGGKWGLDISRNIWKNMEVYLEAHYFTKRGKLTFTQESTRLRILPLGVGLKYLFLKKRTHLYAGAGITYNVFEEKNPIGRTRDYQWGVAVRLGALRKMKGLKKFFKEFIIDAYIHYNYCKMKPAEISIDIGGVDLGLALGFEL